jgi:hypothetical protein
MRTSPFVGPIKGYITASTFHFISPHGGRVRHRD